MILTNENDSKNHKNIRCINLLRSFNTLSIWEKIMIMFGIIGFILTIYFIFVGSKLLFNSDTATANILAKEQIATGSFFPQNWIYVQDLWVATLNLPIVFLSKFITDQILLRSLAVVIQTALLLVVLIVFSRKILKNNSWIIYCAVIFSGISQYYNENLFGQATYGTATILIFLLLISGILTIDQNFKISPIPFTFFSILLLIANIGGVRYIASFSIPFIIAVFLVYYNENHNIEVKELVKPVINFFIWALSVAFITLIGLAVFKYICSKGSFNSGVANPSIYSGGDLDSLSASIRAIIPSFWVLFGYDSSVVLFSKAGLVTIVKLFAMLTFVFVFPVLLTRKYRTLHYYVQRLLLFYWVSLVITILLFSIVQGLGGIAAARYFQVCVVLQIIISCYYIYTFMLKKSFFTCFLSMCALIVFIAGSQLFFFHMNANTGESLKPTYDLVKTFEDRDLKMGYASYWNAYSYSVFADFKPEIVAVIGDPIEPFYHLTSKRYYNSDYYTGKTFLMMTKDEYDYATKDDKLNRQFGKPIDFYSQGGYYINIYDYNISERFINVDLVKGQPRNIFPAMVHNENVIENDDKSLTIEKGGIVYGPYADLRAGNYSFIAEYSYKETDKPLQIKITSNAGQVVISEKEIHPGKNNINFSLKNDTQAVEFVLANASPETILVKSMEILKN